MHDTTVYAILKIDISIIDIIRKALEIGKEQDMKLVDRFWPFMKADYKAAEKYLEAQSRKGLHIKHIDNYGIVATYEKGIPKNVKYCIDYLNLDDADEAENYQTMLEDAGWTYVGDLDKYLIFASKDGETPVPINTDWREEYRLMRKGLWRYEVPMGIIALALLVGLLVIPDITFDTIEQICIGIILWCAGGFGLIGLIYSFLFYWNSGRALKNDEPMKARGEKEARVWGIFHGAFGVVAGIGVLARYICVDYNHWMAGETGAVFFLSMTLIACVCSFLLSTPLHRWVSKRAYTMIDGIFFIIIAIGLFGYFIATQ